MSRLAHSLKERSRTDDVIITENVDFSGLLLSKPVSQGLTNSGFHRPSPIQLKAIPLGRCGLDLIVQAKSGTGKTCVFAVIALETIQIDSPSTQVLVLAPTREIAVQIWEVIGGIGSAMSGLKCHTFIGGLPLQEDRMKLKKTHIAVGTPGRVKQLIETGILKSESVRLFVLDEADKLLEESFQDQINWIYSSLPENKQMLALSATYPEYLANHLTAYMRNPTFLRLNVSDPALLGIRQYYKTVSYHPMSHVVFEEKSKTLVTILSSISFQQCLVFSNLQTRAQNLADSLNSKGWPTACIAGCLDQKDRNHAMAKLKTYKCRILISTDLTARGIDADKVNVIINLNVPKDHETYLHRIGRAGRFGSFGIAVTLISEGQEKMDLDLIEKRCNTHIHPLPDPIPEDLAHAAAPIHLDDVVSSEVIKTEKLTNGHIDRSNNNDIAKTAYSNDLKIASASVETSCEEVKLKTAKTRSNYIPDADEGESDPVCQSASNTDVKYSLVNGNATADETRSLERNHQPNATNLGNQFDSENNTVTGNGDISRQSAKANENEGREKLQTVMGDIDAMKQPYCPNTVESLSGTSELDSDYQDKLPDIKSSSFTNGKVVEENCHAEKTVIITSPVVTPLPSTRLNLTKDLNAVLLKEQMLSIETLNKTEEVQEVKETREKHTVISDFSGCLDAQGSKCRSENIVSKSSLKQTDQGRLEYLSRLKSFIPPKIDLISLFKQTVDHKPVKNPHTYESAKLELHSLKPVGDNVKGGFVLRRNRSHEHEVLLSAVHELQVMFDRTKLIPKFVLDKTPCNTIKSSEEKRTDKCMTNTIYLQPNLPREDGIGKSSVILDANVRTENWAESKENEKYNNISLTNANKNEKKRIKEESTVKPKKTNRRGYTGKFAVAHMLDEVNHHQSVHGTLGNFETDKQITKFEEGNKSNKDENCDQGLESLQIDRNYKDSLGVPKEETLIGNDPDAETYQDLVLESQAVERLLRDKTEAKMVFQESMVRKVSFSSDEILTEDSDFDSSFGDETELSQSETQMQLYTASRLSTDKSSVTVSRSKNSRIKEVSDSNICKSKTENSKKKKVSDDKRSKFQGEEYKYFGGDKYANNYYPGSERRTSEQSQHYQEFSEHPSHSQHPELLGYPCVFPQRYPMFESEEAAQHFGYSSGLGSYSYEHYPYYYLNFYHQWYPSGALPFYQYPVHFQQTYQNYSLPLPHRFSGSGCKDNMKKAFELQTDYIKLMCKKQDRKTGENKLHNRET